MKTMYRKFMHGILQSEVGKKNKLNRDMWLEEILSDVSPGLRILDAGAGELRNKSLCSHLEYVSQDFAEYKGNVLAVPGFGKEVWDTSGVDIISDIVNIPEPNESFDAILCSEVFEHLPDPISALKEFSRLLRPGGKLILTAPFNSLTHQAPFFFYSGFSRFFYEYWCEKTSLKILELIPNGNFFEYIAQELRRVNYMAETHAQKKMNRGQKKSLDQLLMFLESSSESDKESAEVLCFGYHLLAEKN